MNGMSLRSVVLTGALLLVSSAAWANTISPSFVSYTPGVEIVYSATHGQGELWSGDGFTIFDIGGFTGAVAPTNWTVSSSASTSPFGTVPAGTDSALTNVHFTYTGTTLQNAGPLSLGTFIVSTTWAGPLTTDDWRSADHTFGRGGARGVVGNGLPCSATRGGCDGGTTSVPTNVPDGGSTMSLLGLAMLSAGLLRRHLA